MPFKLIITLISAQTLRCDRLDAELLRSLTAAQYSRLNRLNPTKTKTPHQTKKYLKKTTAYRALNE